MKCDAGLSVAAESNDALRQPVDRPAGIE